MILRPITYIIILLAFVLFWSGLSISSVKSNTISRAEGRTEELLGKTTQRIAFVAVASTYQSIKEQTEASGVNNQNHQFKTTVSKFAKRIFSPNERLKNRSFFRNIIKL